MSNQLAIDPEIVTDILTRFIKEEVTKIGYKHAVVGISGGVDSSTSAFLAARALGKENVWGIIMPYKTSSPDSTRHAKEVAEMSGIHIEQVEITPMVDAYFKYIPNADNRRKGNVMARQRMIILYDKSAEHDALVLGTSNKSEFLLGYTTLWGDMASALNPIGDLYKTQVRQLAKYLGVPDEIIGKPPSADLWAGQTDEAELGFTYAEVDKLLYLLVDKRFAVAELLEMGYEEDFIHRVFETMQRTQYKRRLPIIAKLSHRTIDRDFRYPRDWGV
ncbi:MAG: NAD+ synthase [Candidatus Abyssobacteria bacterium SURF_5]|uniref:NH(3)-dependent NAD(+) synthetase n=1 Tax=Abyssobacteria bacterium (strain SURF_5) TaxID=2093360 RepID=A0A3A4P8H7_ABYX5|nr:MAG: NAD+ synthase [Candidatus Abyssubacteria bacterium SURF_5]